MKQTKNEERSDSTRCYIAMYETQAKVELTRPWKRTTMTFEHDTLLHESENFGETYSNLTNVHAQSTYDVWLVVFSFAPNHLLL